MIPKLKPAFDTKVPAPHPQWANLDLAEILSYPSAYLTIAQNNSLLSETGTQAAERLWERARRPGGFLGNTIKLVGVCRDAGMRIVWTRYQRFRENYPSNPMDKEQYAYWAAGSNLTDAQKDYDADPVDEIKALMRPEDRVVEYFSLGNVFLGTMLSHHLTVWGVRTVVLSGYHLDWCIEQAARTCRDIGFMPIVVGDTCGCGREQDEAPTLDRLNNFFSPVVSTATAIALIQEGARRRRARESRVA